MTQPDICIIGAGISGLALARRLQGSGLKVLILESGDRTHGPAAQELNQGTSNAPGYPFVSGQSRGFGGTSRLWYGACIPLGAEDFRARPWLPGSGWPITRDDLAPHYEATRALFAIPATESAERLLQQTPFHGQGLCTKAVAHAGARDLGRSQWKTLSRAPNVEVRLTTTVTALRADPCSNRVTKAQVRGPGGAVSQIYARHFVLACGGIENSRLLLASNTDYPAGLGNQHDLVGRYHMEHPIRSVAVLDLRGIGQALRGFLDRGFCNGDDTLGTLCLAPELREQHGLLDMHLRAFRFHPAEMTDAVVGTKRAFLGLEQAGSPSSIARFLAAGLARGVPRYALWHMASKLSGAVPFSHIRFAAFHEQEPEAHNRITLGPQRDRYGVPLPHLEWSESTRMQESHRRSLELFAAAFRAQGFGRLHYGAETESYLSIYDQYGFHHMGTTRMHPDPKQGVVDANSKVHGLANLYVAGGSVFPTGGAANPSWTIAALADRLGRHLEDMSVGTLTSCADSLRYLNG